MIMRAMIIQYRPASTKPISTIFIREYLYVQVCNNGVTNRYRFDTDGNKKLDLGEVNGAK